MRRSLAVALALVALAAHPAAAWDPFEDELDPGDRRGPDPVPLVVPEGLYLVTDVYAGDRVTDDGRTTTYATDTIHDTPGTYARVLDSVGTGAASGFDGASFNGRARMSDGRAVAGTYYEDFVLTPQGFVSVNVVFFQDDSATRAQDVGTPKAPSAASPPPTAATPPPTAATPRPNVDVAERRPVDASPSQRPIPVAPDDRRESDERPQGVVTAGVALDPSGPVLAAIDVLRGRAVRLWPRALVDGQPVPIRSWRITGGAPEIVSALSGSGVEPCVATWLTLAPAGSAFTLRFEVTSDAAPGRSLPATLSVSVRSPALLQ